MKIHRFPIACLLSLILTSALFFVYAKPSASLARAGTPAPFAVSRGHLAVWHDTNGTPVGILDPVVFTSPMAESLSTVESDIQMTPSCRFRVTALGPHRFLITPVMAWPANRRIHVRLALKGVLPVSTNLVTDADKSVTVNLTRQQMLVYEAGELVRVMPTSTGVAPNWVTPTGTFWIYRKVPDDHMKGGIRGTRDSWDVRHVPWAQYIYGGIAIHGAWWNHRFGTPLSHGCIQLATRTFHPDAKNIPDNAQWLYDFTDIGTPVIVTGTTPLVSKRPLRYPPPDPLVIAPSVATSAASSAP